MEKIITVLWTVISMETNESVILYHLAADLTTAQL